ncbi:uncharacterized protein PV07_02614 [Cladophialophora immunda]|uniref:Uncharacterized protein n=1 Tax=Cladophialophora immunda TaxID=569365 RepID=A0A0D2CIG2_9EURO|nr:uncharacterized protein PV07_02614 [Cladophialophora immunda]KIW30923.1 hypothetical protein PV07_02614 [Cladophialophora immunda]
MDLGNACDRIKHVTQEELVNNLSLLIETWGVLTRHLRSALAVRPGQREEAGHDDLPLPRAPPQHDNNGSGRITSPSSHVAAACVCNTLPYSTLSNLRSSIVRITPEKSISTTTTKTSSKVSNCRPRSRFERAFRNIQDNARNRQNVLKEINVNNLLSRRVAEYPPARAASDATRRKRHDPDRIAAFLESFLAAIHITEKYHIFQKEEIERQGKKNRGRLRNVYEEFADSLDITPSKIPPILKLGEVLSKVLSYGHYVLLLLFDQLSTVRDLSAGDLDELSQSLGGELPAVGNAEILNAAVKNAYQRYQKVANECWTKEKRASAREAIEKIMEVDEASNLVDEDDNRHLLDESISSGQISGTASPDHSPGEGEEFSTPATAISDRRRSLTPCQSSPQPSEPGRVDFVGQLNQDWTSRCNSDPALKTQIAEAHRSPRSLQEDDFTGTSTAVVDNSPQPDSSDQLLHQSEHNPAYLFAPDTIGSGVPQSRKRPHLDQPIDATTSRGPSPKRCLTRQVYNGMTDDRSIRSMFNDNNVDNSISNEPGASNNILHTTTYTSFENPGPFSEHSPSAQLAVQGYHGEQLHDHSTESSASGPEDTLLGTIGGGRNESPPNWDSMFEGAESLCFEGGSWNLQTPDWVRMFEQAEQVNFGEDCIEHISG